MVPFPASSAYEQELQKDYVRRRHKRWRRISYTQNDAKYGNLINQFFRKQKHTFNNYRSRNQPSTDDNSNLSLLLSQRKTKDIWDSDADPFDRRDPDSRLRS